MKAPHDKTIVLLFESQPEARADDRWQARLTFPPGATAETALTLAVEGADGLPIAAGTFEFAGQLVRIRDGQGELPYAAFIGGKHETGLWLHRKGRDPIPGRLTFG